MRTDELTTVVFSEDSGTVYELFQIIVASDANPLPFTVIVKSGPPAIAVLGLIEVIVVALYTGNWIVFDE